MHWNMNTHSNDHPYTYTQTHTSWFNSLTQFASLCPRGLEKEKVQPRHSTRTSRLQRALFSPSRFTVGGIKGHWIPGVDSKPAIRALVSPSTVHLWDSDLPNRRNLVAVLRAFHTSGQWKSKGNAEKDGTMKIRWNLRHLQPQDGWVYLRGEEEVVSLPGLTVSHPLLPCPPAMPFASSINHFTSLNLTFLIYKMGWILPAFQVVLWNKENKSALQCLLFCDVNKFGCKEKLDLVWF